jgi:hypothetical protein
LSVWRQNSLYVTGSNAWNYIGNNNHRSLTRINFELRIPRKLHCHICDI